MTGLFGGTRYSSPNDFRTLDCGILAFLGFYYLCPPTPPYCTSILLLYSTLSRYYDDYRQITVKGLGKGQVLLLSSPSSAVFTVLLLTVFTLLNEFMVFNVFKIFKIFAIFAIFTIFTIFTVRLTLLPQYY